MDRRVRSWASHLGSALRRLQESDGRRIARRNAREDLDKLLAKIRRELHKEFPNFSKDGDPVIHEIPLPPGQKSCALCGSYMGTFRKLADHVLDHHGKKCPCGYEPKGCLAARGYFTTTDPKLEHMRQASRWGGHQMTGHLRAVKEDLKTHLLMGAIGSQKTSAAPEIV